MTDPRDPFVPAMATALLSCLSIAVSGVPGTPQHIAYRVGTEPAHDMGTVVDECCEGIAYVTLGDMWPVRSSLDQDARQAVMRCFPPAWAVQFRVGIIRCVPIGTAQAPPTDAEWNAAFVQNMWDAAALRKAQCCFRAWATSQTDALMGMSVVMNRHVQTNPSGGCIERFFTVDTQFPNCDC